jgi:hypothetical protein
MLSECFNPACHRKLDYLRYGRVVRTVQSSSAGKSVEHYWLCGVCYGTFDFEFKADGSVALCRRDRALAPGLSPLIDYRAG